MSHPFEARYEGHCRSGCGDPIRVGDTVTFTDEGLVHHECRYTHPPQERPVTICQTCWLTKPCECDT